MFAHLVNWLRLLATLVKITRAARTLDLGVAAGRRTLRPTPRVLLR